MKEILPDLTRWLASGERVALATVIRAQGPSPRPVGACLAVTASGKMAGSVSGGCVEGAVFREAQAVLEGAPPKRLRYGVADEGGWEVGLACGGTIEIYLEPLAPIHERLLEALRADETVALVTRLDGGGHLLAWPDGQMEGDRSLADELETAFPGPLAELRPSPQGDRFVQVFAPPPTLTIVGAVHLAQPLVRLAQVLGFRVRVVDARRVFATRDRFPTADELVVAWPKEALGPDHLRPSDALVVLTHDPKFDVPALEIALRSPVGYIGLLGSQSTQARRKKALKERGFTEKDLARIHGPVGLDVGNSPEEIALGILAEIVAHRNRTIRTPRPPP
ncbi:MAG TPA: XdhC family protein [Thermoflexia bacterium]|nr:XdhC family protein [Thermoflexia bacterium]